MALSSSSLTFSSFTAGNGGHFWHTNSPLLKNFFSSLGMADSIELHSSHKRKGSFGFSSFGTYKFSSATVLRQFVHFGAKCAKMKSLRMAEIVTPSFFINSESKSPSTDAE